jgi:hypothetical protein
MDAYHERKLKKHFQDPKILYVLYDSKVAADILGELGSDRGRSHPVQPGVITPELPSNHSDPGRRPSPGRTGKGRTWYNLVR